MKYTPGTLADRLLDVVEYDLLPVTRKAVYRNHNIFGAAVLEGDTLELLASGTNRRGDDPTFHGEMVAMHRFFEMKKHPDPDTCVFLATHEPCSMCLSALAWSGFREIYFLFDYAETANDFAMGHDIAILKELFGTATPSRKNSYFNLTPVRELVFEAPDPGPLLSRINYIKRSYLELVPIVLGKNS